VLQERVIEPLGAIDPVKVNVRVIAATHKDLRKLVQKGLFREDLYYRIRVIALTLPPLRQRREDIPLLIDHFVEKFNRQQGKTVSGPSAATMRLLMQHEYPGNVRELANIIEHAFVLTRSGAIEPHHLPAELAQELRADPAIAPAGATLREMEMFLIQDAMCRHSNNRAAAARELGIDPSTLFRKLRALSLDRNSAGT